jgi:hypothetical protein
LSTQQDVKSARAAVPDMSGVQSGHQRPKIRLSEPERQLGSQNAAFAGNHEHELGALRLRTGEEIQQRPIGGFLREAVKIDPRLGVEASTAKMGLRVAPMAGAASSWNRGSAG